MAKRQCAKLITRAFFRVNRAVRLERAFGAPLSSEATAAGDGYFEYGVLDRVKSRPGAGFVRCDELRGGGRSYAYALDYRADARDA